MAIVRHEHSWLDRLTAFDSIECVYIHTFECRACVELLAIRTGCDTQTQQAPEPQRTQASATSTARPTAARPTHQHDTPRAASTRACTYMCVSSDNETKMAETTTTCVLHASDDDDDYTTSDNMSDSMNDADVYIAATDDGIAPLPLQQPRAPRPASLPPIALARPIGAAHAPRGLAAPTTSNQSSSSGVRFLLVQSTPAAAANAPFTLRSLSQSHSHTAAPSLVVVLTRAQLEAVEQYRWIAFFLFLLYVMTFFAWPTYVMSASGLLTGFIGYSACRMRQQGSRYNLACVIVFIAANYVMLLFLAWVFLSFFVRDVQVHEAHDGAPATILLAVFVLLAMLLHVRALRIARDFLDAFRAGVALLPRRSSLTVVRPPRRVVFAHDVAASSAAANAAGSASVVAHAA